MTAFTLVEPTETGATARSVASTTRDGRVYLSDALGWELKPQGLCRDDVCISVREPNLLQTDDGFDLERLAATLGRPLAIDVGAGAAFLGASARDRGTQIDSLSAPDFELSDLAGRRHRLSEHRGKKVLLVAYASW